MPLDAYDKYCRTAPRRSEEKTWQTVEIGRRFRLGRQQSGISQRTLADRAGVSQSEISRLERGMRPGMAVHRLAAIAMALGPQFPFGTCPHDHRCVYAIRASRDREAAAVAQPATRVSRGADFPSHLDDGANGLDDGANGLDDGANGLDDGANGLDDGANGLDEEVEPTLALERWVPQLEW